MKISDYVHALKIPFELPVSPEVTLERFVYVYLIYGEKIWLIDSGVSSAKETIFNYIRETGRKPEEISKIIQTHTHPDHIGSTQAIKEATGCDVAVHSEEKSWLEDIEIQYEQRPIPGFHNLIDGSVDVDLTLNDGDVIEKQDLKLEVLHTPGHSKGSISLFFSEDNVVFSGDAIPVVKDLPMYEDYIETVNSINKLKEIDNINILLSSWDEPLKNGEIYKSMEESLHYIKNIHEEVAKIIDNNNSLDSLELCRKTVESLGFPSVAVNPHVAKTFEANRKALKNKTNYNVCLYNNFNYITNKY